MPKTKLSEKNLVESNKKVENPKSFVVSPREGSSLYEIKFENGGEVPAELKSLYTSPDVAERAITKYQSKR